MKKIVCVLLMLALLVSLAACGSAKDQGEPADLRDPEGQAGAGPVPGGWAASDSAEITDELRALFDKGLEGLVGVNYLPVAYLGSQVVAGMNHAFLCQAQVVYPDAQPYFAIVYLYADLSGGVSVLDIVPITVDADGVRAAEGEAEPLVGGWTATQEFDVLADQLEDLDKVFEGLMGVEYEPVAFLAAQIVSGVNSAYLCRAQAVAPDAQPYYAIVSVYSALDGSSELLNIADFDFGALCTYGG